MNSQPTTAELMSHPGEHMTSRQSRWLQSLSAIAKVGQATLFHCNRMSMRLLFRLSTEGTQHIPSGGPFILAPNHTSSLDPCVIAAALTLRQFRTVRWAARKGVVTGGVVRETIARLARVLPIRRSIESLAAASAVLDRGENLVWFPEGTRSDTGELQPLKSGIGHLAVHHGVPIIPAIISGAHEAMPPPRKMLRRLAQISIRFGEPLQHDSPKSTPEAVIEELELRMRSLAQQVSIQAGKNL